MNGMRKAALYLHGLNESDRDWLLNSLTSSERNILNEKLLELSELGIPEGTAWLPEITINTTSNDEADNESEYTRAIDAINSADHESVFKLLDHLPVEMVVLVLNLSIWSWRQAYISTQYIKKRKVVLHAIEKPFVKRKTKVQNALILSLHKQLNSSAKQQVNKFDIALETAQNSVNGSIWRKLWRR
ncbi:hypothetical protein A3197_17340 [Candidatus Thiodiazotropha endoloripes]|nr:hypothetical protein A3197_17340 [Candidatus Thiodiazotropha endoloripes]